MEFKVGDWVVVTTRNRYSFHKGVSHDVIFVGQIKDVADYGPIEIDSETWNLSYLKDHIGEFQVKAISRRNWNYNKLEVRHMTVQDEVFKKDYINNGLVIIDIEKNLDELERRFKGS